MVAQVRHTTNRRVIVEYRRLGRAGMKVSAVSLGAWITYGGTVEDDTAAQCIRRAVENGVKEVPSPRTLQLTERKVDRFRHLATSPIDRPGRPRHHL